MKFYEKAWFMWLMLLFFFPIGIFLLWKYSNYSKSTKGILSAAILVLVIYPFLTNKDTPPANQAQPIQKTLSSQVQPSSQPKVSAKSFMPTYTVFGEKDVSTGYAVRKVIQISLPMGLDKKAVEDNLIQAAKEAEKKYSKPDKGLAIDVYAFSKEDIELMNKGEYITTFAECTYAHNVEWGNSNVKYSSSDMKAIVKFNNESYFNKQVSK